MSETWNAFIHLLEISVRKTVASGETDRSGRSLSSLSCYRWADLHTNKPISWVLQQIRAPELRSNVGRPLKTVNLLRCVPEVTGSIDR